MVEPGAAIEDQVAAGADRGARRDRRRARPQPLGLGFDLLRLRPELCFRVELFSANVTLGDEFTEATWIDPAGRLAEPLTPAAAAALALLAS